MASLLLPCCLLLLCMLACIHTDLPFASVPGARARPATYRKPETRGFFRPPETRPLSVGPLDPDEGRSAQKKRSAQDETQPSGWLKSLLDHPGSVVLIDANNVRGQTKFLISQEELADMVKDWAKKHAVTCVLVYDHGVRLFSWQINHCTAVAFVGGRRKADDLIVESLEFFATRLRKKLFVVTCDGDLKDRLMVRFCTAADRYRGGRGGYELMESDVFARLIMDPNLVMRIAHPEVELQHFESAKQRVVDAKAFFESLQKVQQILMNDEEIKLEQENVPRLHSLAKRYASWMNDEARVYMKMR